MARWHKRLVPAIAATSLVLGTGTIVTAVSAAEEAVLIPGATVFKRINPLYPMSPPPTRLSGSTFTTITIPQVVKYSQNALASDKAILDGVEQATAAVQNTAAQSWSSANRWAAWLLGESPQSWQPTALIRRTMTSRSS